MDQFWRHAERLQPSNWPAVRRTGETTQPYKQRVGDWNFGSNDCDERGARGEIDSHLPVRAWGRHGTRLQAARAGNARRWAYVRVQVRYDNFGWPGPRAHGPLPWLERHHRFVARSDEPHHGSTTPATDGSRCSDAAGSYPLSVTDAARQARQQRGRAGVSKMLFRLWRRPTAWRGASHPHRRNSGAGMNPSQRSRPRKRNYCTEEQVGTGQRAVPDSWWRRPAIIFIAGGGAWSGATTRAGTGSVFCSSVQMAVPKRKTASGKCARRDDSRVHCRRCQSPERRTC